MTTNPATSPEAMEKKAYPPLPPHTARADSQNESGSLVTVWMREIGKLPYDTKVYVAADLFAFATVALRAAGGSATGATPYAWAVGYAAQGDDCSQEKLVTKYPDRPDDYEYIRPLFLGSAPAAPAGGVLSDKQVEKIISESDGEWSHDVFHIQAPALKGMLRSAAALSLEAAPLQEVGASAADLLRDGAEAIAVEAFMYAIDNPDSHITGLYKLPKRCALRKALVIPSQVEGAEPTGATQSTTESKLWLWKNGVKDGVAEYWAFDNPYPQYMNSADPQTLGEPCGYALFKPSRQGRFDRTEEQVLDAIRRAEGKEAPAESTGAASGAAAPAMGADTLDAKANAWDAGFSSGMYYGNSMGAYRIEGDFVSRPKKPQNPFRAAMKTEGGV